MISDKIKNLPPRQHQLFHLLFVPLQMKEISWKMKTSQQGCDTQAKAIYEKFGVINRIGLILAVLTETKGVIPEIPLDSPRSPLIPSISIHIQSAGGK